jgi:nicotinate-nucleotide--dimethylbenzimidazole phosphoribosyltransferase
VAPGLMRPVARVIDAALAHHDLTRPDVSAEHILCVVGGLEIAAICGAIIAAAQRLLPTLIDGFIVVRRGIDGGAS